MDYTVDILKQKLDALPADVRRALGSVDVSEKLQNMGEKHGLHIDQSGELFDETGLVMLGLTHPRDYVANLERRLGVSREKAVEVARDVNEQIFKPVRESLKKIHGLEEAEGRKSEGAGGFSGGTQKIKPNDGGTKVTPAKAGEPKMLTENNLADSGVEFEEESKGKPDAYKSRERALDELEEEDTKAENLIGAAKQIGGENLSAHMEDEDLARIEARREALIRMEKKKGSRGQEGEIADKPPHEQKLSGTISIPPKKVEIDPYREPIEDKDLQIKNT